MRWSDQSIEQAIQAAKAKNAIFVVYVEDDTKSTPLHSYIESPDVSSLLMSEQFVAIRICSSDQSYRDFSDIYQLVPIPSLFFIGNNGWPLEIISGELPQSAVVERIKNLLGQSGTASSSTNEPEESCVEENASQNSLPATSAITTTTATATTGTTAATATATTATASTASTASTSVPKQSEEGGDLSRENVDRISSEPETSNSSSSVTESSNTRSDTLNLSSTDENARNIISSQNVPLSERISVAGVRVSSDLKEQKQQKISGQSSSSEHKPATHPSSLNIRGIPRPEPRRVQEDSKSRLLSSQERAGLSLNIGQVPSVPQPPGAPITGFLASFRGWMHRVLQSGRGGITTGTKTGRLLTEGSSEAIGVSGGGSCSRIYEPSTRLSGDPGYAHIQFRLPDGSTHSSSFPTETTIREVRDYVQNNIALPFRDFGLSTSYPRVEFSDEQIDATIAGLGLVPRSVILIIPGTETARPVLSSASDVLWALVTWPFTAVFSVVNYINFFFTGEPQAEINDQSASQQQPRTSQVPTRNRNPSDRSQSNARRRMPSSSVVQREGNVYRLSNRQDDSEDENNTWNGNSTQQM